MPSDSDHAILWPARHIGEHAYCPRLFYYMQVEGVFVPSSDTEQGRGAHARVDRPSHDPSKAGISTVVPSAASERPGVEPESPQPDPDRPRHVRSLALTSEKLSLTATLDLAEISGEPFRGGTAVPVEYRKGRPKLLDFATDADAEVEPGQQPLARAAP